MLNELLSRILLVDHHTHSILSGELTRDRYLSMLSESDRSSAAEAGGLDTQVGFAVRRWCAPLLGLAANVPAHVWLEQRLAMRNEQVAARFLPHAGMERLLIDTGLRPDLLIPNARLGQLARAATHEVVRLEAVAEGVASQGVEPDAFGDAFRAALQKAAAGAVGLKSIVAYRAGLDIDPTPPTDAQVAGAAVRWLAEVARTGTARLTDPVLLRFLLWEGVAIGKPLQIHTGYGDTDLDLHRCDPLLLTEFLRLTDGRCPVLLLHTYPYQRQAGYLAQMFAHVYLDVGLAINYTGAQSVQVIAESLEVAPFTKLLFSSDSWGIPELHLLGSWLYRRGLSRVLGEWVVRGDWSHADAARVVSLVSAENARRVYGLPETG